MNLYQIRHAYDFSLCFLHELLMSFLIQYINKVVNKLLHTCFVKTTWHRQYEHKLVMACWQTCYKMWYFCVCTIVPACVILIRSSLIDKVLYILVQSLITHVPITTYENTLFNSRLWSVPIIYTIYPIVLKTWKIVLSSRISLKIRKQTRITVMYSKLIVRYVALSLYAPVL
jgi:hypothetical protein